MRPFAEGKTLQSSRKFPYNFTHIDANVIDGVNESQAQIVLVENADQPKSVFASDDVEEEV